MLVKTVLVALLLLQNAKAEENSTSIIGWHYEHVEAPFVASIWLLLAGVAKILFHVNKKFGDAVPDSALLIVVGLGLGLFLKAITVSDQVFYMDSKVFFLYLLPPIIFDAGYFMPNRLLFENFGSVMMFAVIGTIWNTITIGGTLALLSSTTSLFTVNISMIEAFLFSSLISAVDPVAVITVFEEIHVNEFLFINVFGEALFNDGIAAVLFQIFNKMAIIGADNLKPVNYVVFSGSFFAVALGGAFIGVLFALFCAILTRYTQRVKIIGPVFVFVLPYLAYLVAEMTGFSAILAICCCGIVMKQYIKCNITHEAASSIKYFVKMLAQSSEIVVFMFLGLSAISSQSQWDYGFIAVSLAACLIYRTLGVIIQCAILNRYRAKKFTFEDQFVMSYGGLRGAIAFGLLSSIPSTVDPEKRAIFTSTTITVICFTVFLQGATIKPLLHLLKVEKQKEHTATMVENVYNKYFDFAMAGIEEIAGQKGSHSIRDWFERMNAQYLKPYLTKQREAKVFDASQIIRAYQKITLHEAMEVISIQTDDKKSKRVRSLTVGAHSSQKRERNDLDNFLTSEENVEKLYSMFSTLLDRKLSEYMSAQNKMPHSLTGDENDDIKDDYLASLNNHQNPLKKIKSKKNLEQSEV
ncbi:unnamed protein product [Bursaphelenchus xylophilus]|uniref:Sodium/hydrogen exchanger n=1 Tax=Bursaphelenchus xylophilus TaxID=6326 RepID=A0A1I7S547_BURXY|nr:unnamed protein product [Bursaphelenchus xylophilus]CAG9117697.1 unnamed protein product [Bursaphelenchus xylophilus]